MKAITKVLAGGVVAAALFSAAPAAAQYYPQPYGYGYNNGANVIGQVINQVLGGGAYGGYGYNQGYGVNSQAVVGQCVNAVQARLARSYGNAGYGYGGGYGYNGYSNARVLGISRVERRSNGGLQVRGVATTGMSGAYGYNGQAAADISFRCRTDYRGYVVDVDLDRQSVNYGYNQQYTPYNYDYSQYGYRRY